MPLKGVMELLERMPVSRKVGAKLMGVGARGDTPFGATPTKLLPINPESLSLLTVLQVQAMMKSNPTQTLR